MKMAVRVFTRCWIFFIVVQFQATTGNVTNGVSSKERTKECPTNYRKTDNGLCEKCPAGSQGKNCSTKCPNNFYGESCLKQCNCAKEQVCNESVGCIPILRDGPSSGETNTVDYSSLINTGPDIEISPKSDTEKDDVVEIKPLVKFLVSGLVLLLIVNLCCDLKRYITFRTPVYKTFEVFPEFSVKSIELTPEHSTEQTPGRTVDTGNNEETLASISYQVYVRYVGGGLAVLSLLSIFGTLVLKRSGFNTTARGITLREPIDDMEESDGPETAESNIESDEEIESGTLSPPAKRTKTVEEKKSSYSHPRQQTRKHQGDRQPVIEDVSLHTMIDVGDSREQEEMYSNVYLEIIDVESGNSNSCNVYEEISGSGSSDSQSNADCCYLDVIAIIEDSPIQKGFSTDDQNTEDKENYDIQFRKEDRGENESDCLTEGI